MRSLVAALMLCAFGLWVPANAEEGIASTYSGKPDEGGSKAANGEHIDPSKLTAAHRTLPFCTRVEVRNLRNGKSVVVRINDRGPFKRGRIIDLTPAGEKAIGSAGLAPVRIAIVR